MIKIIVVGKLKEKALTSLVDEYSKRLLNYSKLNIIEVNDFPGEDDSSYAIEQEGQAIISKIKSDEHVVLLDINGQELSSLEFASNYQKWLNNFSSNITFIIGGSYGVSQSIKQRANYLWSFSLLTFPHQMMRVMLLEQIYRAYKINSGQKYHK